MKKEPLISLIIPVYNGAAYIRNIMNCINNQTYTNLEIIFVNDGSTDDTSEKILKCTTDNRIILIEKENGGASSARNRGLRAAQGEYIAFIDVDDYIAPSYISYLYELIYSYSADMSCCNYIKLNDSEQVKIRDEDKTTLFNRQEALLDLLYRKRLTGYPYLKLIKKDLFLNMDFPEELSYCEDFITIMKILTRCNKIIYGSKILYLYYQHPESATHNFNSIKAYQSWSFVKEQIDELCTDISLRKAGNVKMFILSTDFCSRIWRDKDADKYKKEMLGLIHEVDKEVVLNSSAKPINRLLAVFSCLSPTMMIQLCRFYNILKQNMKFETRHSV